MNERLGLANLQVIVPGVALVIAGPAFALRFANDSSYVAVGIVAAAVGIGLLVLSHIRHIRHIRHVRRS